MTTVEKLRKKRLPRYKRRLIAARREEMYKMLRGTESPRSKRWRSK